MSLCLLLLSGLGLGAAAVALLYYAVLLPLHRARCRRRLGVAPNALTVAFFHPYCNAGGGGERVLWLAIKALATLHEQSQQSRPLHVVIYAGAEETSVGGPAILARAEEHFGVAGLGQEGGKNRGTVPISFVFVRGRALLEARRYPVCTMLGQSLGSMAFAAACFWAFAPDVFLDTTGFAFTYPLAALLGRSRVAAYVHYPTISTDMLALVREQRPAYNNDAAVAGSGWKSRAKLLYYHLFARLYGLCGGFVRLAMVNSSWTRGHIQQLWRFPAPPSIHTVFPPCDVAAFKDFPLSAPREPVVLSVGQFRPEKDHPLQVRAFARFLRAQAEATKTGAGKKKGAAVKLVLLGSCRGPEDEARVAALRRLVAEEGIEEHVEFVVGAPFPELKRWLGRASVGLHTMWNEHFGICVVEYMAAGLIPLAHNSGGPRADIVQEGETGFLASDAAGYAQALGRLFATGAAAEAERVAMRRRAREAAGRFSDEVFLEAFGGLMRDFLFGVAGERRGSQHQTKKAR